MGKIYITLSLVATTMLLIGDSDLGLPSSVPIEVFEMKENQIAFGYIGVNVNIDQKDDYYNDKIGTAKFKSHGLIYTQPKSVDTFLGKMFELSYTAGAITSELKENQFSDNGKDYNNTWDKTGFYLGIRPAFSTEFYKNNWFVIKNSTAIHTLLYMLEGDFSVNNGVTNPYAYNEKSYGLAIKPSTVLQFTLYPTENLGITAFGGVSAFAGYSYTDYTNKVNSFDADSEKNFFTTGIKPLFGYDVTYKFFGKYKLAISSAITKQDDDNSIETIIRYTHSF
jgi:hypothetical protein